MCGENFDGCNSSTQISLLTVGILSTVGSIFVLFAVAKYGAKTTSARLVIYLHATQIIEDIAALPFSYDNDIWCKVMGLILNYFILANIIVAFFISLSTYHVIFSTSTRKFELALWMELTILFSPSFLVFGFYFELFGQTRLELCSTRELEYGSPKFFFMIFVFLIPGWVLVFFTIVIFSYIMYRLDKNDSELRSKLIKGLGIYSMVTVITFIPKTLAVVDEKSTSTANNFELIARGSIFIAGLIYTLNFFADVTNFRIFQAWSMADMIRDSSINEMYAEDFDAESRASTQQDAESIRGTNSAIAAFKEVVEYGRGSSIIAYSRGRSRPSKDIDMKLILLEAPKESNEEGQKPI